MTLQWIPLDLLVPHPENSNRMPPRLVKKLKSHIERTGLYEPLVVRPLPAQAEPAAPNVTPAERPGLEGRAPSRDRKVAGAFGAQEGSAAESGAPDRSLTLAASHGDEADRSPARYQILNGHHRAQVLRELGHTRARCDVWQVDDEEARLLLATLNRLEGRDDPSARARLVARLAEGRSAEDLSRLLPEPPDAVERLLRLAQPPPAPLAPEEVGPMARPMTFFLADEQYALVTEALREVGRDDAPPRPKRTDALERLALWYLESLGLR